MPKAQSEAVIDTPGRFLISATCRCGEGDCENETYVQAILRMKRAADTPDADQPGDHVVFVPEDLRFPEGWAMGPDLTPRCPKHTGFKGDRSG